VCGLRESQKGGREERGKRGETVSANLPRKGEKGGKGKGGRGWIDILIHLPLNERSRKEGGSRWTGGAYLLFCPRVEGGGKEEKKKEFLPVSQPIFRSSREGQKKRRGRRKKSKEDFSVSALLEIREKKRES